MTMEYDNFLTGDDGSTPEGFTYQDLILADGGEIHFTRTSPCPGTNGFCQEGGSYTATSTPSDYYGATIQLLSSGGYKWEWTKKDGTGYLFALANCAAMFVLAVVAAAVLLKWRPAAGCWCPRTSR